MPYFSKDNPNHRVQTRSTAHVWLQEDAYESVPPAADVLYVHATTEPNDVERAAKRRRIAAIANAYENGKTPHILTAALKGPFDSNWHNPWGDKDQNNDKVLVSQLRAMLQKQREEAEAARMEKIERKKQRRQNQLQRTSRATELQQDGLGQSPTLPVDLTTDGVRRTLDSPSEIHKSGSVKDSSGKDAGDRGEGWLCRQRSRTDLLKSSPPNDAPTCSLPIRSSQVEAENNEDVGLAPSVEEVTIRESARTELRAVTKHTSRNELGSRSSPTKSNARRNSRSSRSQRTDSSLSLERIPSSRPDNEPDAQGKCRLPSPPSVPQKGVPSKFAVAYQNATPAAGTSPRFAYRRVAGKSADVYNQDEVLVPGTEPKSTQARPKTSRPVSFSTPIIAGHSLSARSTNGRKAEMTFGPRAIDRKNVEQIAATKDKGKNISQNYMDDVQSQRSLFSTQSRKDRTDSYKPGSEMQNAQVADAFTISNEQYSTQAAMLEVHGAFQEALESLERAPFTEQEEETCLATPDQGIPEIVDTVTPFRDFHLRTRSRSPTSKGALVAERKNDLNTQDLFAAVSPFRGSPSKASPTKQADIREASAVGGGKDAWTPRRRSLAGASIPDGHGDSDQSLQRFGRCAGSQSVPRIETDVLRRQTTEQTSTTPRSRESQSPSSLSSEFSLTSPADKAQAMTFEEGQKLLSHDSLDVDANLEAMGSFLESWDVDTTPSLAKETPRDSSRRSGTQRSRHGIAGRGMA